MNKSDKTVDAWLVLSYQSGNDKAFSLLVKRWHPKLCRQAFWYTKDMDVAKDVVQESWSTIFRKIHTLRNSNRFGSWALTIVTRNAVDFLKRKNKSITELKDYYRFNQKIPETEVKTDKEKKIAKLLKSISKLPEDQGVVLRLFYLESYSLYEISTITGVSMNTVKTRLFRAREKLKKTIKSD